MDAMSMGKPWLRHLVPFGLVLALVLGYLGMQARVALPVNAATNLSPMRTPDHFSTPLDYARRFFYTYI